MGEKIIKTIISGDREVDSYDTIERAIKASGFEITELVEGGAIGESIEESKNEREEERLQVIAKETGGGV